VSHDATTPTGLLHLRTWLPAPHPQPVKTWCDTHHLEQLAVPGFRRVRRFSLVRSEVPDPPRYLTIYDLDHLDVLESEGYADYRARSTGLPELLQGKLRVARSDAWLVAGVPAVEGMVAGGAGLGLAICREIMVNLGGSIAYLPGQGGAAFRVAVPVRPESRVEEAA
jgi:hypothetical protein